MVPWKPSFYLRPWVNKGNFVYLLLQRRVSGHIRQASACWSTHCQPKWLPWSQDQPYLFAQQHLVKWQHLSVCTRLRWERFWSITANTNVRIVDRDHFWESHIVFHVYFADLSLPLLLFQVWWDFSMVLIFAFYVPKLSYLTQDYQSWFWGTSPIFFATHHSLGFHAAISCWL